VEILPTNFIPKVNLEENTKHDSRGNVSRGRNLLSEESRFCAIWKIPTIQDQSI
jgi:hypothetical protein